MSTSITARNILDEDKRQTIISMLANGSSRRVAARFIGCAPSTITRTAARCPEFAARLVRAEQSTEIGLLKNIQVAAKDPRHWRAAAWLLERRNPEDFAARPPRLFTVEQVGDILGQVVEVLRSDLPAENCRRALEKLDALLAEFKTADAPVIVAEGPEERTEKMTNDQCPMTNDQGPVSSVPCSVFSAPEVDSNEPEQEETQEESVQVDLPDAGAKNGGGSGPRVQGSGCSEPEATSGEPGREAKQKQGVPVTPPDQQGETVQGSMTNDQCPMTNAESRRAEH